MSNSKDTKHYYTIHAWTGVITGLLLFIVCFSGSIALFDDELTGWEASVSNHSVQEYSYDLDVLAKRAIEYAGDRKNTASMFTPTIGKPFATTNVRRDGHLKSYLLDPLTGEAQELQHTSISEFLSHLHTDLYLPRPYGRYLVGLTGLILLFMVISGVLTHRKILKELFIFRWQNSWRLTLTDLHKILGSWGLVFNGTIAFTGSIIGLLGLIGPIMVLSAFDGDLDKAREAFLGPSATITGEPAKMLPIQGFADEIAISHPSWSILGFNLDAYNDKGAQLTLLMQDQESAGLSDKENWTYSLVTGEQIHRSAYTEQGPYTHVYGLVIPLHYALYGGIAMKFLYLILGLGSAIMIFTGLLIWLEKRVEQRQQNTFGNRLLGKLITGVCGGQLIATSTTFLVYQWLPGSMEIIFWLCWLSLLIGAWWVKNSFIFTRLVFQLSSIVLLISSLSFFITEHPLFPGAIEAMVAISLMALLMGIAGFMLPKSKPKKKS